LELTGRAIGRRSSQGGLSRRTTSMFSNA
jgi:hypothetical protein